MGRASRRKRRRAGFDPTTPEGRLAEHLTKKFDDMAFRNPEERPREMPALSERISILTDPFEDGATTFNAYHALTTIGVFAWNLSLQPDQEHEALISKAIRRADMPDPATFRSLAKTLVDRKRELFPQDRRLIAGHEVTETDDGFHIVVASFVSG